MTGIQIRNGNVKSIVLRSHEIVDRNRFAGMHHKRLTGARGVLQHGIEGSRLQKLLWISRRIDFEYRRASGIGVRCERHGESAVLKTLGHNRVGIELQLHKGLSEEALGIGNGAAEPERRTDGRNRHGAPGRQYRGPGQVARGSRRAGNRVELGFVMSRAPWRVFHFEGAFYVFRVVSETAGTLLRLNWSCEEQ